MDKNDIESNDINVSHETCSYFVGMTRIDIGWGRTYLRTPMHKLLVELIRAKLLEVNLRVHDSLFSLSALFSRLLLFTFLLEFAPKFSFTT